MITASFGRSKADERASVDAHQRGLRPRHESLSFQSVALALSSALAQVSLAVAYVVVARAAAAHAYGVAVAMISVSTAVAGLIDFGVTNYSTREIAARRMDEQTYARIFRGKVMASGIVACLALAVSALAWQDLRLAAPAALLVAIVVEQSLAMPLRGTRRADRIAVVQLCNRAACLVLCLVLVSLHLGAQSLVPALSVGSTVGAIVTFTYLSHSWRPRFWGRGTLPWKSSAGFGIFTLANSLHTADVAVVGAAGGPAVAGVFGAVNRWTQPMGLLATAFTAAAAPFMARERSVAATWAAVRKSTWLLALSIVGCVVVALLATPIVMVVFGNGYAQSAAVLRLMAIGTALGVVNQPMAVLLQSQRRERVVAWTLLVGVVVYLGAAAALSATLGAIGVGYCYVGLQAVMTISLAVIVRRHVRREREEAR